MYTAFVIEAECFKQYGTSRKISHHFSNTRLNEKQLDELDDKVISTVKRLFQLYPKSSGKAFFVDKLNGGLGIKRPSHVYRAARISNLMKMLNHEEENIRFIARESLKLDMKSRGVSVTDAERNFLGYSLDQNHRLAKTKTYGGSSDWPDLLFHVRKLQGSVIFKNEIAEVIINDREIPKKKLRQEIENELRKSDIEHCLQLQIQGNFIAIEDIDKKISHQIYYGWKLSDSLVKFILRARMNQLPCNQVIHMWNKDHEKSCTLCNFRCESMAHLMKLCRMFSDLYSRRHDRVVDAIHMRIETLDPS